MTDSEATKQIGLLVLRSLNPQRGRKRNVDFRFGRLIWQEWSFTHLYSRTRSRLSIASTTMLTAHLHNCRILPHRLPFKKPLHPTPLPLLSQPSYSPLSSQTSPAPSPPPPQPHPSPKPPSPSAPSTAATDKPSSPHKAYNQHYDASPHS